MSWRASAWAARQTAGSAAAKSVLFVVAEAADPSGLASGEHLRLRMISDRAEVSRRTAIDAIAALETAGIIRRENRFHGRSGAQLPNDIRLLIPEAWDIKTATGGSVVSCTPPVQQTALGEGERPHPGGVVSCTPKPILQPTTEPKLFELEDSPGKISGADIDSLFDAWWSGYPLHVGRGSACKAFRRIVKSGAATLDQLVVGRDQYAAQRAGQDPKFTAHASTWLNAGRWADEAPPVVQFPSGTSRPTFEGGSAFDQAVAGIRR
jgi:hypothetical protein